MPDFTSAKWSEETSNKEILETIRNGTKDKKGKVRMPAYRTRSDAPRIDRARHPL